MTEDIKSRHEMLVDLFAMYGTTTPMDIGPRPKHRRTVTEITQSIHENIHASINYLKTKPSIQKVRDEECRRFKIIRKTKNQILVKIAYGGNNRVVSEAFAEKYYPTIGEAVEFLNKFVEYLLNGVFEPELTSLLQELRNNAAKARKGKAAKNKNIQQVKEVVEYVRSNVVALIDKKDEMVG